MKAIQKVASQQSRVTRGAGRTAAGSFLTLGLLAACSGEPPDAADQADGGPAHSVSSGALATFGDLNAWAMPVNVCFEPYDVAPEPGDLDVRPTPTQYGHMKTVAIAALRDTWGLAPGVSFVNRGDCPFNGDVLTIELKYAPGWGGSCGHGRGAFCEMGGATVLDGASLGDEDFFRRILAHEVGHGLGFAHEHQRPGPDNPVCSGVLDSLAACERCLAGIRAGTGCAAPDWNGCKALAPADRVTDTQWFNVNSDTYARIQGDMDTDGKVIDDLDLLTPYDPRSIVNYCALDTGLRHDEDYHPTPYDLLGAEMTYPPAGATYGLGCSSGCFHTADGVLTRRDGAVTTTWTERGALGVLLVSPVNGQSVGTLATSGLPSGTSTLSFSFRVPRTGSLIPATGTLVNSDPRHTGLLAALL